MLLLLLPKWYSEVQGKLQIFASLTFELSSSTSACRAAQAAGLLLCPFASSADTDVLKLPPKAKGVERSRGRRQRSVGHWG